MYSITYFWCYIPTDWSFENDHFLSATCSDILLDWHNEKWPTFAFQVHIFVRPFVHRQTDWKWSAVHDMAQAKHTNCGQTLPLIPATLLVPFHRNDEKPKNGAFEENKSLQAANFQAQKRNVSLNYFLLDVNLKNKPSVFSPFIPLRGAILTQWWGWHLW